MRLGILFLVLWLVFPALAHAQRVLHHAGERSEQAPLQYRPWDDSDPEMRDLFRYLWGRGGHPCPTAPTEECTEPRTMLRGAGDRAAEYLIRQIEAAKAEDGYLVPRSWYGMLAMTESDAAFRYLRESARRPRTVMEKRAAMHGLGRLRRAEAVDVLAEGLEAEDDEETAAYRMQALQRTMERTGPRPDVVQRMQALERRESAPRGARRMAHRYLNRLEAKGLAPKRTVSPQVRQDLGLAPSQGRE